MREPDRIPKVLSALERYWRRHPDLRLGQLVGNFARHNPYYLEDEELLIRLEAAARAASR